MAKRQRWALVEALRRLGARELMVAAVSGTRLPGIHAVRGRVVRHVDFTASEADMISDEKHERRPKQYTYVTVLFHCRAPDEHFREDAW
jgi:hypothetical protein